jgi:hypothetical protein
LQNSPVLTIAHGQPVVIDGGKAGILIELSAQTGKLLWKLPVGVHTGHDNDGLLTEHATPTSHIPLAAKFVLEPGAFGGIETQLATNGSTVFAAVNNLSMPMTVGGAVLWRQRPRRHRRLLLLAGAGVQVPKSDKQLIIAYRLGASGKLPGTVAG